MKRDGEEIDLLLWILKTKVTGRCEGVALEMSTVLRSRKDKSAYSVLSDSKTEIDSCVTENNFSVALSIHFLASPDAPVCGSAFTAAVYMWWLRSILRY